MRLTEDELWSLTFREYMALRDRWSDEHDREDFRCWLSMSIHLDTKKVKPWDFFPALKKYETTQHDAIQHDALAGLHSYALQLIAEQERSEQEKQ